MKVQVARPMAVKLSLVDQIALYAKLGNGFAIVLTSNIRVHVIWISKLMLMMKLTIVLDPFSLSRSIGIFKDQILHRPNKRQVQH
jgi:hypothetical protein